MQVFRPLPWQKRFLAGDKSKLIRKGAGAGKTEVLVQAILALATGAPRTICFAVGRYRSWHIDRLAESFAKAGATYYWTRNTAVFPNGTKVYVISNTGGRNFDGFSGDLACIDHLDDFDPSFYNYLKTRFKRVLAVGEKK